MTIKLRIWFYFIQKIRIILIKARHYFICLAFAFNRSDDVRELQLEFN